MITAKRKLKYNDPRVVLYGQVYTDFFFGRPDYGESPETDEIEHAVILALDEPVFVEGNNEHYEGNFDGITESYVDRVQISISNTDTLRTLIGQGIKVQGRLFHAHTGHHHTNVLISVEGDPISIDERNIFPKMSLATSGSGFLLGNSGLIGTAAHVLEDIEHVTIARGLYREKASIVAVNRQLDIAILRINPTGTTERLISSREKKTRPMRTWMGPRLGERVYAFGFPLRPHLPHTLNITEGLISAEIGMEPHQFQMSAAIQPGNSGGPVFDEFGNFLGIAVSSVADSAQNMNFCVGSRYLNHFCDSHGIKLNETGMQGHKITPVSLAESALHFCVEVEGWCPSPR